MVLDMTQDGIILRNLTVDDPLDPATPQVNRGSADLDPIKAWIQKFLSIFKRRTAPFNAAKTTSEQYTPLIWEELEDALYVPILDDGRRFASVEFLGPWFPEANPAHPEAQTWRVWRSKRSTVLSACSLVAALVMLINFTTTVYLKSRWKTIGDIGTIYRGDCSQAHRLSSRLHIVINVLSTALLSASHLCMQLLAAPVRREIDKAHENYIWLDIGVPSFRNLKYIGNRRTMAIILLATSSIPLHFL